MHVATVLVAQPNEKMKRAYGSLKISSRIVDGNAGSNGGCCATAIKLAVSRYVTEFTPLNSASVVNQKRIFSFDAGNAVRENPVDKVEYLLHVEAWRCSFLLVLLYAIKKTYEINFLFPEGQQVSVRYIRFLFWDT